MRGGPFEPTKQQRDLVEAGLIRKPGVDLGLFDELGY